MAGTGFAAPWGRADFRVAGLAADAEQATQLNEMARVAVLLARFTRASAQARRTG